MSDERKYVILRHNIPVHGKEGRIPDRLNVFLYTEDGVPVPQRDVVSYHEEEGWIDRFSRDSDGCFIRTDNGQGIRVDRYKGRVKASFQEYL